MVSALISRVVILVFGTLYPAYASYKAVKTKNVKEYVKWMMYWIVFAFFTCIETFTDIFIVWLPFYYELKIIFVLWLLSPATKGSSIIYRKIIHPQLSKREKEIDSYITKASDRGYSTLLSLGSQGFTYATNAVLNTAMKGQNKLAEHVRKSYSMNDLSSDALDSAVSHQEMELSEEEDNRVIEESYQREMMEKEAMKHEQKKTRKRRSQLSTASSTEHSSEEDLLMESAVETPAAEAQSSTRKGSYSHKETRATRTKSAVSSK